MSTRTAISIGNFDGAHLGHAALMQKARASAGPNGRVVALSLDPHPRTILRPDVNSSRLSTFDQRSRWLRDLGADEVVKLTPTREFLSQSPREFVRRLMNDHSPTSIIEGPDFRFGKGREGSMDTLAALGKDHGFDVMTIDPVETAIADCSIVRVSSSLIRWMLNQGRVRDAARLLGRPFEIEAIVVSGDKRGRSIGVPTANLDHRDFLLPADGIYSGRAIRADGAEFPAAISIGTKPTFGQSPRVCEAHLIGHRGPADEYGWLIRLQFNDWLRDQLKYADVNDLVDQLQRDIDRCDDNSPPWPSASHSLQSPTCSFARVT